MDSGVVLVTAARHALSLWLDDLELVELVRCMIDDSVSLAAALLPHAEALARAVEVIADRFRAGGSLVYVSAGTSGRLGVLDASECSPTFGTLPGQVVGLIAGGPSALLGPSDVSEDDRDAGVAAMDDLALTASDVVVGIAVSGNTPFVLAAG